MIEYTGIYWIMDGVRWTCQDSVLTEVGILIFHRGKDTDLAKARLSEVLAEGVLMKIFMGAIKVPTWQWVDPLTEEILVDYRGPLPWMRE